MTLSSSLSVSVRDAVQSGAGCVNDACVGNYAPVYVLAEGYGTPLPRVDLKGTWDRGGFGPKATATGVHPASRAATGREAVPANHGTAEMGVERAPVLWCGFYKKEQGKGLRRRRLILQRGPASAVQRANT